jgi:hypothetical protein
MDGVYECLSCHLTDPRNCKLIGLFLDSEILSEMNFEGVDDANGSG